jgi:hypothetical protein
LHHEDEYIKAIGRIDELLNTIAGIVLESREISAAVMNLMLKNETMRHQGQ